MEDQRVREVYDACYQRLVGQVYAICGDRSSAEEVVQKAFVRALTHSRAFSAADRPEAWLRRVAINLQRNRWRHRSVRDRYAAQTARDEKVPGLTPDHVMLVDALRALPLEQREAIVLHHPADLPVFEVAQTLGVPEGTVKARLSRGRAALARALATEKEDRHA